MQYAFEKQAESHRHNSADAADDNRLAALIAGFGFDEPGSDQRKWEHENSGLSDQNHQAGRPARGARPLMECLDDGSIHQAMMSGGPACVPPTGINGILM